MVLRDPPEEEQHSLGEGLKVVVPVDLCSVIQGNFPKHLKGERKGICEARTRRTLFPTYHPKVSSGSELTLGQAGL